MKAFARVLVLLLTIPVLTSADTFWRQYGFDAAHTSYNKAERVLNKFNVNRLALFWSSEAFHAPGSAPTVGFTSVFVATDGRVRAYNADTGSLRWVRLSCSGEGTQQPALVHGLVIVGDGGGDLAAYDPASKEQVWCDDESGSITSAPAVAGGSVLITNGVDAVAVDPASGLRRWTFTAADFNPLTQTPAVANGGVFVTGGNSVFALDEASGRRIWRHILESQANISAASVSNGLVYVGGTALYAFSAADGHLVWRSRAAGVNVTTPAIAEGRVFVNSEDPNFGLFAFSAADGTLLWNNQMPGEPETTPTVANGMVYDIADTGELMMFDAETGAFLASVKDPDGKPFRSDFGSQPAVADGVVYVATGDCCSPNRVDAFRLGH
ncbi:MAG TPA: PQQ-binding-like beta-propeller repeat protein [Chthoniobacterales bacterium]|jgi:outer membrane protein assembly factor BamB|nr:PQQ-binding-like beta-propeller repeat protein [Chthoniobacterales bacterium]